jgi:hypothetical protein
LKRSFKNRVNVGFNQTVLAVAWQGVERLLIGCFRFYDVLFDPSNGISARVQASPGDTLNGD